jgi:nucleotidyltransferase substrate binding protein (TIGR01987 family)
MRERRALEVFELTVQSLAESLRLPPIEPRDFAGIVQNFEIAFEAAWKALKSRLDFEGLSGSEGPRGVITAGFQNRYLEDEVIWFGMLRDRNLTVHTYNRNLAEGMVERIRDQYLPAFIELQGKLS